MTQTAIGNGQENGINLEDTLNASRQAFYHISVLTTEQKNKALSEFATLIEQHEALLLAENNKDMAQAAQDGLASVMVQRLKLDSGKLQQITQGIRDLIHLPDPAGRILSKTLLDDGLVLEKVSVPLGVIGIIFESRPDVIPQVLSLILKSGNAVVMKGGREARYSNAAFMQLTTELESRCPFLPKGWATLLETREAVHEMLNYPQYINLIIPRGSNQLVQSIMAATKIPVMGHADGICHLYVHAGADLNQAIPLIIDAKTQYPSACNAVETVLVDAAVAGRFLPLFEKAAAAAGIILKGCETTQALIFCQAATEADWSTEYGDVILSVKVVDNEDDAIQHINRYGSHHTDGILTTDPAAVESFFNQVDSASVFANASTRFADGFRYGLGAEVGISTARTHARGPVGLEGLVIYKYRLYGQGHTVAPYTGQNAKPFLHKPLPC